MYRLGYSTKLAFQNPETNAMNLLAGSWSMESPFWNILETTQTKGKLLALPCLAYPCYWVIVLHTTESPLIRKKGPLMTMMTQWENHQGSMTLIRRVQQLPRRSGSMQQLPTPTTITQVGPSDIHFSTIHTSVIVYCDSSWFCHVVWL